MHCLEHVLFVTAVAVDSKAELVRVLGRLAGISHDYVPDQHVPDEPEAIHETSDDFVRRFGHLLHGEK